MGTRGIEGLYVETRNWGKSVAFWQALGYELVFETDHHSGQLVHHDGGPYLFLAERPENHDLELRPVLAVENPNVFEPPAAGSIRQPFTAQHWGVVEMLIGDPDGRGVSLQAPLPEGIEAPAGHASGGE